MTVAGLGQTAFLDILKANGYDCLSHTHWDLEGVERIVLGKDGHTFVFRLKKFYFYPEVLKRCQKLEIKNIPDEHKDDYGACVKAMEQHIAQRQRMATRLAERLKLLKEQADEIDKEKEPE